MRLWWLSAAVIAIVLSACSSGKSGSPAEMPQPASVTGRVLDPDSVAIAGASVQLTANGATGSTSQSGTFRFTGLQAGSHSLTVRKEGHEDAARQFTVEAGQSLELAPIILSLKQPSGPQTPDDGSGNPGDEPGDNSGGTAPGSPAPRLHGPNPDTLALTGTVDEVVTGEFSFMNTGDSTLTYELTVSPALDAVITPARGQLRPEEQAVISVSVECDATTERDVLLTTNDSARPSETVRLALTCMADGEPAPSEPSEPPVQPEPAPVLTGVPLQLVLSGNEASTVTAVFQLRNTGSADLEWSLEDTLGLTYSPESGVLVPGSTVSISVTGTCTATTTGSLVITSNDPERPAAAVQLRVFCEPPQPEPAENFTIDLEFTADVPPAYQEAVEEAADRWSEIIVGGLQPAIVNANCYGHPPVGNRSVDNLLISVKVENLGPDALGQGGPCDFRGPGGLPSYGIITLNASIIDNWGLEALAAAALHEIGHVLGIGTLWNHDNQPNWTHLEFAPANACNANVPFSESPLYTSSAALAEYRNFPGRAAAQGVPVAAEGTGSNRCDHWLAAALPGELMAPEFNPQHSYTLSRVTAASLADLGYTVDLTKADQSYQPTSLRPADAQDNWFTIPFDVPLQ